MKNKYHHNNTTLNPTPLTQTEKWYLKVKGQNHFFLFLIILIAIPYMLYSCIWGLYTLIISAKPIDFLEFSFLLMITVAVGYLNFLIFRLSIQGWHHKYHITALLILHDNPEGRPFYSIAPYNNTGFHQLFFPPGFDRKKLEHLVGKQVNITVAMQPKLRYIPRFFMGAEVLNLEDVIDVDTTYSDPEQQEMLVLHVVTYGFLSFIGVAAVCLFFWFL